MRDLLKKAPRREDLATLIAQAKALPPMTPAQLQEQRISFAFSNLPEGNQLTREEVAAIDYAKYGNLTAMMARLAASDAMAVAWLKLQLAAEAMAHLYNSTMADDAIAEMASALAAWDGAR